MAKLGHKPLCVLVPVCHPHPNVDWKQERNRYRQVALRQLVKLGLGDIEKRIRFEEFERMYLVGGGTHPGSGLPVIFESARISAKLLLEDLSQAA